MMDDFLMWVLVLFGYTIFAVFFVKFRLSGNSKDISNGKDISPYFKRVATAISIFLYNMMKLALTNLARFINNVFRDLIRR